MGGFLTIFGILLIALTAFTDIFYEANSALIIGLVLLLIGLILLRKKRRGGGFGRRGGSGPPPGAGGMPSSWGGGGRPGRWGRGGNKTINKNKTYGDNYKRRGNKSRYKRIDKNRTRGDVDKSRHRGDTTIDRSRNRSRVRGDVDRSRTRGDVDRSRHRTKGDKNIDRSRTRGDVNKTRNRWGRTKSIDKSRTTQNWGDNSGQVYKGGFRFGGGIKNVDKSGDRSRHRRDVDKSRFRWKDKSKGDVDINIGGRRKKKGPVPPPIPKNREAKFYISIRHGDVLRFAPTETTKEFEIGNQGVGQMKWNAHSSKYINITPNRGTFTAGQVIRATISVDRSRIRSLPARGAIGIHTLDRKRNKFKFSARVEIQ